MKSFVEQWTAHKKDLKASFNLLYDQILLIAVDETQSSASGCSIDTSVHFLKKLQHQLSVDFFNRMLIPFVKSEDQLQLIPMSEIKNALEQNMINNETLTLNPSVSNKIGFETEGWIPLGKSWMANLLQLKTSE
ncbi:MAG TPA: hypothetical protein PKH65_04675 [Bacteroidia bacterium]|nr:hypothetical protein [Bacteroidia bacterium]HNT79955.1 hypothetical protein [Bacteroidia bacterium]